MPMTIDERLEMLQQASRNWLELKRVIDRLSDDQLTRPNTIGSWSGKDVLAHITAWEEVGIDVIREMEAGNSEQWPDDGDDVIDELNEELLEPYRELTVAEVRAALNEAHFTLMQLAETSPDIRSETVLEVTADHYPQHIEALRSLLW
jgi:hypothetical protein